jgi:hypothetical protein
MQGTQRNSDVIAWIEKKDAKLGFSNGTAGRRIAAPGWSLIGLLGRSVPFQNHLGALQSARHPHQSYTVWLRRLLQRFPFLVV